MNALVTWFGSEAGTALLLALAHSLWMAAVLAFFAALALRTLPVRRAGLRYTVLLASQAGMLLDVERRAMSMGRAVALRAVEGLKGPAAYGLFRPVILIPSSLLTGMPEEAMRAVSRHVLEHEDGRIDGCL